MNKIRTTHMVMSHSAFHRETVMLSFASLTLKRIIKTRPPAETIVATIKTQMN